MTKEEMRYQNLEDFHNYYKNLFVFFPKERLIKTIYLAAWIYKLVASKDYYDFAKEDAENFTAFFQEEINNCKLNKEYKFLYKGDIFKILNNNTNIEWNNHMSSFSKSFDFTKFKGILDDSNDKKYTFIHLNTNNLYGLDLHDYAFDNMLPVNAGILYEKEIIFPMNKNHLIDVYNDLTIEEFKNIMNEKLKGINP